MFSDIESIYQKRFSNDDIAQTMSRADHSIYQNINVNMIMKNTPFSRYVEDCRGESERLGRSNILKKNNRFSNLLGQMDESYKI